jgi:hypothetical protein
MRQSASSPLRPLQCQPPIILRPSPAPCPAVARTGRNLPWHCWREYPPRHEQPTTGRAADDTGQYACQRRAVARRVLLAVPPPGGPERGQLARSCASASVRPAHGLHPLRHHRCRRPAELAERRECRHPVWLIGRCPSRHFGFHSRASFCASAICAGVMRWATRSRLVAASLTPCAADKFNHICART